MANADKIKIGTTSYNIKDTISGYTTNTGTITQVSGYNGLTGSFTTSGTIKCDLKSETKSTLTAASRTSTANREYPVGLDANSKLSVNVPWTNTTLSAGDDISISSSHVISIASNTIGHTASSTNPSGSTSPVTSVAHNTYTNICTISNLAEGIYLIMGTVTWSGSNINGCRRLHFATSSAAASSAMERFANLLLPAYNNNSNEPFKQQIIYIWNKTSATTNLHMVGWQNSGVSLSITYPGLYVIRIC